MKYNEYRGVRGLVLAEITSDDTTSGYVTEEWQELSGVQSISETATESSESHFYDNKAAIVVNSEGADELTLVVSALANKTRALIEGTSHEATNDLIVGTQKQKKYFALGYIGKLTDGTEEFNIRYKGKFSGGSITRNTEDDGTEGTNVEYTFTSIYTTTKLYTKGSGSTPTDAVKNVVVPASSAVTEVKVFGTFTSGVSSIDVPTPDDIKAMTA